MKICHEVIVILPGCTAEKSAVFFDFLYMVSFDGKQINDTGAGLPRILRNLFECDIFLLG